MSSFALRIAFRALRVSLALMGMVAFLVAYTAGAEIGANVFAAKAGSACILLLFAAWFVGWRWLKR